MNFRSHINIRKIMLHGIVGYFGPLIALCRLRKKRSWNYAHQLRVVYRYSFGK